MTKPTNWVCAQRRLRSAWASAQSYQSSWSTWRKLGSLATHWVQAKTLIRLGGCPGWSESLLGTHSFCWFCHVTAQMLFQGQNNHSIAVITQELNYLTWVEAFTCLSDDRLPDQLRAMYCDLIISECNQHKLLLLVSNWASSWHYGTYHIGDQRRVRRACATAQSRQSLRCSHTWSMEVVEGPNKNQTSSSTGWLRMRIWRMSLRRTKRTIIS